MTFCACLLTGSEISIARDHIGIMENQSPKQDLFVLKTIAKEMSKPQIAAATNSTQAAIETSVASVMNVISQELDKPTNTIKPKSTVKPVVRAKPESTAKPVQAKKKVAVKSTPAPKTNLRKADSSSTAEQAPAKIKSMELSNGNTINYSRLIPVKATAYTADAEENGIWGAFDFLGNPLKLGTIAVDPDVIPMGSEVYITGYSFNGLPAEGMIATANDQGGSIKGKRVDIFIPTSKADATKFGMQDIKIYILE